MKRRSVAVTAVCATLVSQAVVMAPANGAPACFGRRPTIVGTEENNRLRGTPGPDVITLGWGAVTESMGEAVTTASVGTPSVTR